MTRWQITDEMVVKATKAHCWVSEQQGRGDPDWPTSCCECQGPDECQAGNDDALAERIRAALEAVAPKKTREPQRIVEIGDE